MSSFTPSPKKSGSRRASDSTKEVTPEDYEKLVAAGRELLDRVKRVEQKQGAWNEEMQRFHYVEEQQRLHMEVLSNSIESSAIDSLTNPDFASWVARIDEHGENVDIDNWYHMENVAIKTPFSAVVPCPRRVSRKGTEMIESSINGFDFKRFYVQTVPVRAPLSELARAFVPSPAHVPEDQRASKSDLGGFSYVASPCSCGADVLSLIENNRGLREALDATPCLLLNDFSPRMPVALRCFIVAGRCVAAEVACDEAFAPLFGVTQNDAGGVGYDDVERRNSSPDNSQQHPPPAEAETPCDVLAYAIKQFVERDLIEPLGQRSYEAIVLADVKNFDPRVLGPEEGGPPYWPSISKRAVSHLKSPFDINGIRFSLLNLGRPDGDDFELFGQDELRAIAGYMARRKGVSLPPVLRFLDGREDQKSEESGEERDRRSGGATLRRRSRDEHHPRHTRPEQSPIQRNNKGHGSPYDLNSNNSVISSVRHSERAAERHRAREDKHKKHETDRKPSSPEDERRGSRGNVERERPADRHGHSESAGNDRHHDGPRPASRERPHEQPVSKSAAGDKPTAHTTRRQPEHMDPSHFNPENPMQPSSTNRRYSQTQVPRLQQQQERTFDKDKARGESTPSSYSESTTSTSRLPSRRGSATIISETPSAVSSVASSLPLRRRSYVVAASESETNDSVMSGGVDGNSSVASSHRLSAPQAVQPPVFATSPNRDLRNSTSDLIEPLPISKSLDVSHSISSPHVQSARDHKKPSSSTTKSVESANSGSSPAREPKRTDSDVPHSVHYGRTPSRNIISSEPQEEKKNPASAVKIASFTQPSVSGSESTATSANQQSYKPLAQAVVGDGSCRTGKGSSTAASLRTNSESCMMEEPKGRSNTRKPGSDAHSQGDRGSKTSIRENPTSTSASTVSDSHPVPPKPISERSSVSRHTRQSLADSAVTEITTEEFYIPVNVDPDMYQGYENPDETGVQPPGSDCYSGRDQDQRIATDMPCSEQSGQQPYSGSDRAPTPPLAPRENEQGRYDPSGSSVFSSERGGAEGLPESEIQWADSPVGDSSLYSETPKGINACSPHTTATSTSSRSRPPQNEYVPRSEHPESTSAASDNKEEDYDAVDSDTQSVDVDGGDAASDESVEEEVVAVRITVEEVGVGITIENVLSEEPSVQQNEGMQGVIDDSEPPRGSGSESRSDEWPNSEVAKSDHQWKQYVRKSRRSDSNGHAPSESNSTVSSQFSAHKSALGEGTIPDTTKQSEDLRSNVPHYPLVTTCDSVALGSDNGDGDAAYPEISAHLEAMQSSDAPSSTPSGIFSTGSGRPRGNYAQLHQHRAFPDAGFLERAEVGTLGSVRSHRSGMTDKSSRLSLGAQHPSLPVAENTEYAYEGDRAGNGVMPDDDTTSATPRSSAYYSAVDAESLSEAMWSQPPQLSDVGTVPSERSGAKPDGQKRGGNNDVRKNEEERQSPSCHAVSGPSHPSSTATSHAPPPSLRSDTQQPSAQEEAHMTREAKKNEEESSESEDSDDVVIDGMDEEEELDMLMADGGHLAYQEEVSQRHFTVAQPGLSESSVSHRNIPPANARYLVDSPDNASGHRQNRLHYDDNEEEDEEQQLDNDAGDDVLGEVLEDAEQLLDDMVQAQLVTALVSEQERRRREEDATELRKARMMAIAAVVTANAALETVQRVSKCRQGEMKNDDR